MTNHTLEGLIVNPFSREKFYGRIIIKDRLIHDIQKCNGNSPQIITCGLIDAHVHIESSLLPPREYARLAVRHGVVGCMADPHEIANVCGIEGVRYMINNGKNVPFHYFWGASPCVPATTFETAGGELTLEDVKTLLDMEEVTHLAEVMNWPGVVNGDPTLMRMINYARAKGKAVDAHAPGLEGRNAWKYFGNLGPAADHECFKLVEAIRKIEYKALIAIREGSAAKNFEALIDLLKQQAFEDRILFCADDAHPDFLSKDVSYILSMIKRSVERGIPIELAIKAATANPINHYKLPIGRMNVGESADLIVIENLNSFKVSQTYVRGELAYDRGNCLIESTSVSVINNFVAEPITANSLTLQEKSVHIKVIGIQSGELVTDSLTREAYSVNGYLTSNTKKDVLKYALLNRYARNVPPAIAFVHGMGFVRGAIASSVGHDSHNIGCIGVDDESMARAMNLVIKNKGGLALVDGEFEQILPLPIAGLMSDKTAEEVAFLYTELDRRAKVQLGSQLPAPFMTLSFLCLTVIPSLKLSDKGLFDGDSFKLISLDAESPVLS